MATAEIPKRRNSRLVKGFGQLTLDPALRLRSIRQKLAEDEPLNEAWTSTAEALAEATAKMERSGEVSSSPSQ